MSPIGKNLKEELMLILQKGVPLTSRCFAEIGKTIGISEADVLEQVQTFFEEGTARRMGGLFDLRRLGYTSVLCGANIPAESMKSETAKLIPNPGITHCYSRKCADGFDPLSRGYTDEIILPNLWFTLSAPAASFQNEFETVKNLISPCSVLAFPALQHFKISVILDPRSREEKERPGALENKSLPLPEWDGKVRDYSEREKDLIRIITEFPLCETPFKTLAENTGYSEDELLTLLTDWKENGILKRIALILRHYKIGFTGNGMCAWQVPSNAITEKGRMIAERPEVTHCYERETIPKFPFNLYAMIHAKKVEEMLDVVEEITKELDLRQGIVLVSDTEYKKASMKLFPEAGKTGVSVND